MRSASIEWGPNLVDPLQIKTSKNVCRLRIYVLKVGTWFGVGFEGCISLAREADRGKPTTTEELASRGTLHHGEHVVGYFTNR